MKTGRSDIRVSVKISERPFCAIDWQIKHGCGATGGEFFDAASSRWKAKCATPPIVMQKNHNASHISGEEFLRK